MPFVPESSSKKSMTHERPREEPSVKAIEKNVATKAWENSHRGERKSAEDPWAPELDELYDDEGKRKDRVRLK